LNELDKELVKSIPIIDRIRYAAPERVPQDVRRAAAETGFYIARTPVMMDGRIELLQYYRPAKHLQQLSSIRQLRRADTEI